ncbi:3'-5' exonuclease [Bacillus daqingensis]|uniref:3'-5' exonuclease n=1 Tax=Bacillus daqingensis TaxID=872396 RepID=A0ABV9NXJ1_9BACI
MAITVPEFIKGQPTAGERLVFNTLKKYLDDDYVVYYEPVIDNYTPDFLIIGPHLGVLILEVKDYTINTIKHVNSNEWTINTNEGTKVLKAPLIQAREYMFKAKNLLGNDEQLKQQDGKYKGQLIFPCGYGAVLTRLNQKQYIENNICEVSDPQLTLTREEIDPDNNEFDEELLIEKLLNMFIMPFRINGSLTHEQINAIRYQLFPEVRISHHKPQSVGYREQMLLSMNHIKAMDIYQEKLAKQLGDKHRLVRGVAGSGKTLILASRVRLIKQEHPDWKVLVLCYNISLSRSLLHMIEAKMEEPADLLEAAQPSEERMKDVTVKNFHEWIRQDLLISEKQIPDLIEKLEKKEAILPKYDAILIDEGQDFETEWMQLVSNMLNKETASLLLVEDKAQTIYSRKTNYLQKTGLDFRGRSKVLDINYRNTAQIVQFAWDFFQEHTVIKKVVEGDVDGEALIHPKSTKRKGADPIIVKAASWKEEAQKLTENIRYFHEEKGVPYEEMLVLYRVKRTRDADVVGTLQKELENADIPYNWVTESPETKRDYEKEDGCVKLCTFDSSKGLDFQAVFIVNTDSMPFQLEDNKEKEAARLYIGMTRAINYLTISYSGLSDYTEYFDSLSKQQKQSLQQKSGS